MNWSVRCSHKRMREKTKFTSLVGPGSRRRGRHAGPRGEAPGWSEARGACRVRPFLGSQGDQGGRGRGGEQGGLARLINGGLWAIGLSLWASQQAVDGGRGDGPWVLGMQRGSGCGVAGLHFAGVLPGGPFAISETWFIPGGTSFLPSERASSR